MPSPKRRPKNVRNIVPEVAPVPASSRDRSTTTSAQLQRVIAALRTGPKTTHDLRCLGIYQCPARVKQLRDEFGFKIVTSRVTLVDRDGYSHPRAGLYELIADPPQLSFDFGRDAANDSGKGSVP